MLRFQVPLASNLLNLKHEIVKQPVRTWRKIRLQSNFNLQVKPKIEPEVEPPAGARLFVHNRNPRNLERLAIANKNYGWSLDIRDKTFWHQLIITESSAGVKVSCVHHTGKVAISASSDEWCLRKYICKKSDKSAYINVGRVFAQRCLQSGLTEMFSKYRFTSGGKLAMLIGEISDGGVTLKEPDRMHRENPRTKEVPLRPWNVIVE